MDYVKLAERLFPDIQTTAEELEALAEKAVIKGTGARGLRSIIENMMSSIMFDLPSRKDVAECIITRETVDTGIPKFRKKK